MVTTILSKRIFSAGMFIFFILLSCKANEFNPGLKHLSPEKDDLIISFINNDKLLEKYRDEGAVYTYCFYEYIYHKDNLLDFNSHHIVKIFDKGKFDITKHEIQIDKSHSLLDSIYIRSINSNGIYREINPQSIHEVSLNKHSLSNIVTYSLPSSIIQNGDYLEIVKKAHWYKASDGFVSETIEMGYQNPSELCQLHIEYPSSLNLKYRLNHGNGYIRTIKKSKPGDLWFETKDLPGIHDEPERPRDIDIVPTVSISNLPNFGAIARWYLDKLPSGQYKIDDYLNRKMDQLTQEAKDDPKVLAEKIYDWTINELKPHTGNLKAGDVPQTAMGVFKNGYLDCRDMSSFLVALYRRLNFEAYEAWVSIKGLSEIDINFPMQVFDHAITALKIDENYIFLDGTSHFQFATLPYSEQGRPVLILYPDSNYHLSTTPFSPPNQNEIIKKKKVELNSNGSFLEEVDFIYVGDETAFEPNFVNGLTEKQLRDYIQKFYISDNRKLIWYNIKSGKNRRSPLVVSLKLKSDSLGYQNGKIYLKGTLGQYLFNESIFEAKNRVYDLELGKQERKKTFYNIRIPSNLEIVKLPVQINMNNDFFSLKREATYDPIANEMSFIEIFERKISKARKEDFQRVKNKYRELKKANINQEWILGQKEAIEKNK